MRLTRALMLLALLPGLPVAAGAEDSLAPEIVDLRARWDREQLLVSFRVAGELPDEALERIRAGIPVTFQHRLEVFRPRGFPVWVDKSLAKTTVKTSVEYDTLTRRYALTRVVEQKSEKKKLAPPRQEQTRVVDDLEQVRSWMTGFEDLPVFDPARPYPDEKRLKLRVVSVLERRYVLLIFPTTLAATAEQELRR